MTPTLISAPKHRQLKDYREQAEKAIQECIARNEPFTVDTVRTLMGVDVKDAHHNVLPAMLARRVQAGQIVRIGSVRSPNRSRKGGWNALWIKA
nr:MAG TPA: hypothetical protein [Caudoviricetes sp.]